MSLKPFSKICSILFFSVSCLFSQVTLSSTNISDTQSIQYQGPHLVIIGSIDTVFVQRIKAAYQIAPRNQAITTFEITSLGGDIEAAISLGEFIFKHQLSVYIPEVCLSSCANYLFTAGKDIILSSNAVLGWHGGAQQKNLTTNNPDHKIFKKIQDKELAFFQLINVDQKICTLGQNPPYNIQGFWDYSLTDLDILGLKTIKTIKTSTSFKEFNLIVHRISI